MKATGVNVSLNTVEDANRGQILGRLNRALRFMKWMADVIRPYVGEKVLEIGARTGNLTLQVVPRRLYCLCTITAERQVPIQGHTERIVLSLGHCCGNCERMSTKDLIRSIKSSMGALLRESSRNCRFGSTNQRLPRVATGEHVLSLVLSSCPISRPHICDVDSFRSRDPMQRRCRRWMGVLPR